MTSRNFISRTCRLTSLACAILGVAWSCSAFAEDDGAVDRMAEVRAKAMAATERTSQDEANRIGRTVFQVLLGEIALRRGQVQLGSDAWADLAQFSRDPQALERASEVAVFAGQSERALELARLWLQSEPESLPAQRLLNSLQVKDGQGPVMLPHVAQSLALYPDKRREMLLGLAGFLISRPDRSQAWQQVCELTEPYLDLPESYFARAQMAYFLPEHKAEADHNVQEALKLRPDWQDAVLFRADLYEEKEPQQSVRILADFLQRNPQSDRARLAYARVLLKTEAFDEAVRQFEDLLSRGEEKEFLYPLAIIKLQRGQMEEGMRLLDRLFQLPYSSNLNYNYLHFVYAQVANELKKPELALDHLYQIRQWSDRKQYLSARSLLAHLLAQQGRLSEARAWLQTSEVNDANERKLLIIDESLLLREYNEPLAAYNTLVEALKIYGDESDLLYETAMTAESMGRNDLMEKHLRVFVKKFPQDPYGLNALGFLWAEQGTHLAEAQRLIERALKQKPDDPFITDSLGWVFYRQGKLTAARQVLEKAYRNNDHPEISAHLVEVLQKLNQHEEAQDVLQKAWQKYPQNPKLAPFMTQ